MDRQTLDTWCERGVLALILAVLVFAPLATGAVRPQDFLVVEWLTIGMLALWSVRFFINPKHRLLWPPVCWAVLAFLVYAVGRSFTADIEYVARQELVRVLVYGALFFAVVHNLHKQELTQFAVLTVITVAMLVALYAIFQFVTNSEHVWHFLRAEAYRRRGSGTFLCPNHTAGYLEMILPLGFVFTLIGRFDHLAKILLGYASLVIFAGIGVTVSRGGWIATGVALLVFFIWLARQRDYRLQGILLLAGLLLIGAGFFFGADLPHNQYERLTWASNTENVRLKLWGPAVQIWREHFLFGGGPDHFDYLFNQHRVADPDVQARPERVHNDYLNTLADWGLVGGLLVAAIWGIFFWQVFRAWKFVQRSQNDLGAKRSNKSSLVLGASLGLVAILVHSIFDFNMHIPANAILAVTLLGLVAGHFRFASESYWHTVRWQLRLAVLAPLFLCLGFLCWHATAATQEQYWLLKADAQAKVTPDYLADLKNAFRAAPKNADTAYRIGESMRQLSLQGPESKQEPAQEALGWFKASMELNAYDPYPVLGYGMTLDSMNKLDDAKPYFEKASQLDPHGYRTLAHRGWDQLQRGHYADAKPLLEESLRLRPRDNTLASSCLAIAKQRLDETPPPSK